MRILSQDGLHEGIIDVPYGQVSIEQKQNEIWCGYSSTMEKHCVKKCFAKYSTEAKARNAMKMFHEKYSTLRMQEIINRNGNQAVYEQMERANKFELFTAVFQFPADDEVEIYDMKITYKGYTLAQTDYNYHYTVFASDGHMVMHVPYGEPMTEKKAKEFIENYIMLTGELGEVAEVQERLSKVREDYHKF